MSEVPRRAGATAGPWSRRGRAFAQLLVLSAVAGALNTSVPVTASAAGTIVFDQPFRNNTANGDGAVVLPALPTGQSGTNTACLTAAGNTSTGVLRSCAGTLDISGTGKLRLTDATTTKIGGLLGAVSVPTSQGLDVTFNTYQYGGTGADGMTFVLAAVNPATSVSPANIGQSGGALGYSAFSSLPGLAYGYLGIGFDVYGNFSNSAYQGSGCTNPAYVGTGSVRVPGQIVIRGPGNGTVGYCAINSTATTTAASPLALRTILRTAIPVQVGINPTNAALTTAAGLSIPANSYRVVTTLPGGTVKTLTGTLPAVSTSLFPASWLNANGIPRQLAFGWVASTGAITDFHEVDNARVSTISAVPELTVTQTGYSAATSQPGDPVTYNVVAGVAAGLQETTPVAITQTLPAGTVPVGAYGTGWVCAVPSGRSVTCTNSNGPFPAGATLPPLTVVGIVTGTGVTAAQIQSGTVVTASSEDANPAYLSTTTAGTLPATPGGISLSPASGTISGGGTVTVSGTNISNATAIEIGTTAQQQAGTPVVLLPCPSGVTTGCFVNNNDGTLTIPSMPARASAASVNVTVVTLGLAASAAYTYTSAPATPAAPTAVAGVTGATVTWTAPASNGSAITGYVVTPYVAGVAQTPVSFDASATSRTLTGLTAGTSYTFTVAAVNAVGTGAASPASNAVVPYNVPGRPTVTAAAAGTSSANLTWTAPASNGSTITGYVVTPYIGGVAQPAQTFSGTATSRTVTGLVPGTSYTFTVAAVNAAGPGQPSPPSAAVVPNAAPAFTFTPPPGGEVNVAYSVPLTVTGGTAPYVWSVGAGSLPPGLTLNTSTGVLSGTPTTAGTYSFTAQVTDASNVSTTRAVILVVAPLPTLTFPAPPGGEVNVAYSVPLTVTGGTAPYVWSVSAGSLPPGLTLNTSTGVLSGTPTTGGTYSFSVRVVDALNQNDTRTVSLVIAPLPTFTFNAPPPGQVGVAYSVPLTVTGGITPYTWSVGAGSLPPGLTLNTSTGVLSGTPTTTGSYPVTFRVVDANGQAATRAATLVVTTGPLVVTKTASASSAAPGDTVGYTITVNNTGASAFTGVTVSDPLAGVLDDAAYNGDATATGGTASFADQTLAWTGDVAAGTTVTITYSVTVNNPDTGNKVLANTVTSPTVGTTCPAGGADPRCSATVAVSGLSIVKTADAAATTPGRTVRFTVTATNTGQTPYAGASFADAMAGMLDDAVYNGDASATTGVLSFGASTLTWTGNLAPGASATITYSVTVRSPATGDRSLVDTISSGTPGSTCPRGNPGPQCTVTVPVLVPALAITSGANVSSTTPGSVVNYTFTASNTGQTPYTGTSFVASLAGVLDDATFNEDLVATSGSAVLSPAGVVTWTGDLPLGASVTVTGSVTVNNPDAGDRLLSTSVTSAAPGGNCPVGNQAPACLTNVPVLVPGLTITKVAGASTTTPGSVVRYSVAVTNTGQTPYTGATFADALAGVLDDATYNADAAATSGAVGFAGSTLTWTGDLAVGATATVTYSVTVNDPDTGNRTLTNTISSSTAGGNCAAGGGDSRCSSSVTVLVPQLTITGLADVATTTPGSVVRYTATLANTGQTPYAGISATIDLSAVADDATYNGDLVASSGGITLNPGGQVIWTGDIAVGATVTITGSVTVNTPVTGDKVLRSAITSAAPGSTCPVFGATAPGCFSVVTVLVPELTLRLAADTQTTTPGDVVTYTFTVANTGETAYTGAVVSNPLTQILNQAVYNGDATATSGAVALAGSTLTWTGDLAVGASATVTYTVTVRPPNPGDTSMVNTLVSNAPGSTCPPGGTGTGCSATVSVLVPGLTVVKTANATTTTPGSTVGYTVTVANSGQTPYTGATFADALAGVLDDATYNADATATSGTVGFAGTSLTWTGNLPVGASATITYTVTVRNPDLGDRSLVNTITSPTAGGNCAPASGDPRCTSTVVVLVPTLTITGTAFPATAVPGSTITHTITATNTGRLPYTGATFTDALAGVLDDAAYNGDATATSGTVAFAGTSLTWTGNLPVGASATVTFTVTVDNPAVGDLNMTSAITSVTPGNNCPPGGTDPRCGTGVPVTRATDLTFDKAASTASVEEGEVVTYTVTISNGGLTPYVGATFTDALTGVLDDATYNGDAVAGTGTVTYTAPELTWTGTVPAEGSTTVTYSVTANAPDAGDGILSNTLVSDSVGGNCAAASTDPRCAERVTVASLTIVNTSDSPTYLPGDVVRYTTVMTNTGQTPYNGISVLFNGIDGLDDAVPNGDQRVTSGSLSLGAEGLTWTGDLPVGGSVTLTGSITVNNPDLGDRVISLTSVSAAQGSSCPVATAPGCTLTVRVLVPGLTIGKVADRTAVAPGSAVAYTLTITNSGESPYTGATVTDALAGVLDEATYKADATATSGTVTFAGTDLTWTGDLPVGASATVIYSVTAEGGGTGDKLLTNTVSSTEAGSTCSPASGDPACGTRVVILTPILTIVKNADKASTTPGGTVAYTITATNTGQVPFGAANLTDALAGVLDDAAYNNDVSATRGTAAFGDRAITWSGALDPGQAAVITYSVTTGDPGTGDQRLANTVTSTTPGTICPAGGTDPRCSSEVLISRITITNSADVTTAVPAGKVNYTITIANTGRTPYNGVVVDDLLADVLDDATYNNDGTATAGGFTVAAGGDRGQWRGALPVGAVVTVTFSVTVSSPDPGNKVLGAVVTSATPGTNCPAGSTEPACTSTVTVLTPALAISKSADRTTVTPGGTITYTITATNTGETPYTGATVTDRLVRVLTDGVYNGDAAATRGTVVLTGPDVIWTGDLAIGASVTITYSVTVLDPAPGDKLISNRVFSDSPGGTCPSTGSAPACTTLVTVLVPALTIVNVADTATATPGGTVGYTITITNTGQTPYTGAVVTEELAGVLDDATYNGDATATAGTVGFAGSTLTWTGDLAVGASEVVMYSVTVDSPDNGDRILTAVAASNEPGTTCPVGGTDPACVSTVTVLIPGLAVSTVADRATTTPGGTVRFTITIANTGQTPYGSVSVTDELAGVLDDATYNGDATASTGTLVFADSTLTWSGALDPGAAATVGFTVTAKAPGAGDRVMTNVVASEAPGGTCPAGSTAPPCSASVTVLVPALDIVKTADAPTAVPGGTVGYTIVVTNTGETPYDAASVTDPLTALLDEADYNADAAATTGVLDYSDEVLTWTGALAVGASATITYSVTVHDADDVGGKLLGNTVISDLPGSSCPAAGAAAACSASVSILVPELTITKSADRGTVVAGGGVTYTITAVNTGETDHPGATIADRLAGVLDDAAYGGDAVASTGVVTYTEPTLTWTGDLAVGAAVTITYSVDVAFPGSGDGVLSNTATSAVPGSICSADGIDPRCTAIVTVLVPELAITKSADTSGSVVAEQTVRYTITATNTGEAPHTAATFADSLTGVLDDAAYNGDAVATFGTVTYTEPTLTWTGDLPVDASVAVTFSVTVDDPDTGDAELDNRVTSTTTGSTCPAGGTDPDCSVLIAVTPTSITLIDLTPRFTMAGRPYSTVRNNGAVSMTVITNSVDGYTVTVRANSAELASDQPENTATIPIENLRVRESGTSVFHPLSPTDPVLVHEQDVPSSPSGDAVVNDFEADIPFVPIGDYSATLTYVATAK